MAIEGADGSQKAPTIASSAPDQVETSPTAENSALTLVLAQPSAAAQEEAASRSALPPTVAAPQLQQAATFDQAGYFSPIGGVRYHPAELFAVAASTIPGVIGDPAAAAGTLVAEDLAASQPEATGVSDPAGFHRDSSLPLTVQDAQDRPALGEAGRSESGLVLAPQPQLQQATGVFDPAGFHFYRDSGLCLTVRDAQDSPARTAAGGVFFFPRDEREPDPSTAARMTNLGGHLVGILRGPARGLPTPWPRHHVRIVGEGWPAPAVRVPARDLAIVPSIQRVPPIDLLPELARTTVMFTGPERPRVTGERSGLLSWRQAQSPLRLEVIEPAPRRDIGVIGDRMPPVRGPGAPEMPMVPWRGPHAPHVGMPPLPHFDPARATVVPTGREFLRHTLERAGLLPWSQHQHAQSLERVIEPTRDQYVRHRLALAPSRPDNRAADYVAFSRADAQEGWAQLQARRRECEELRQHSRDLTTELALQALHSQELQEECWRLRQALDLLHQTPQSSSGSSSRVAGERRSGVCGDCCFRPADMLLEPCLHIALCRGCYLRRQLCPCCGLQFAFPGFE